MVLWPRRPQNFFKKSIFEIRANQWKRWAMSWLCLHIGGRTYHSKNDGLFQCAKKGQNFTCMYVLVNNFKGSAQQYIGYMYLREGILRFQRTWGRILLLQECSNPIGWQSEDLQNSSDFRSMPSPADAQWVEICSEGFCWFSILY